MNNSNLPSNTELPSIGKLIKSTVLAILIAALILVTVVLPAEYGLDPTGIGEVIGLLKMGEIKASLAQEAAADRATAQTEPLNVVNNSKSDPPTGSETIPVQSNDNARSDEVTFSLSPNEGTEIKLTMNEGDRVDFAWWTSGGRANFDTHADSKELEINYHGYGKGSAERSEGVLKAAFDGNHGWFWRNRTSETMTVTLQVSGDYSDVVRMK